MAHWNRTCLWTFSLVHYHYCVNFFLYSLKQSIVIQLPVGFAFLYYKYAAR